MTVVPDLGMPVLQSADASQMTRAVHKCNMYVLCLVRESVVRSSNAYSCDVR